MAARLPAWLVRMPARNSDESHRSSTPLELFFDLCFVVAIAQAASSLHHALDETYFVRALIGYPTAFFAIWWAWVNFTWFASAYDNDDVIYRICVFVQVAGVLVLAAGVPRMFADDTVALAVAGYLIMRVGLIALWIRAALSDPPRRRTNLRYAIGLSVAQLGWIVWAATPRWVHLPLFLVLAAVEMSVPIWAERFAASPWHPDHIAERYGLFTIIVLGESVLSATVAVQSSLDAGGAADGVLMTAFGALLIVCSMWWIYFAQPAERLIEDARHAGVERPSSASFVWGYGHYFVYAAAAAVGGGIASRVAQLTHHTGISSDQAVLVVAVPVAIYTVSVWVLHRRSRDRGAVLWAYPVVAVLILLGGLIGLPVVVTGLLMVALVAVGEVRGRAPDPTAAAD